MNDDPSRFRSACRAILSVVNFPRRAAATLLLIWAGPIGWAYMEGYLPLTQKELARRFPQHVVSSKFVQEMSTRIGQTAIRFVVDPNNEIHFSGKDLSGKPWTVAASAWRGGGLYAADLDHNGITDIIFASYTGGNGLAPPMHILTLLFDAAGRPVPSEMDGYFEIDARGVKDLVDLDGDGRAELIRQSWDDGYWVTSVYEARDAHWHLIRGAHADRQFPLYTRFTYRTNHVATTPAPGRHPREDDLSNAFDSNAPAVKIKHLTWADVQQSGMPRLQLSDGRNCGEVGWYSTAMVVLDSPERRVAATLGAPEEAQQFLQTIVRRGLPVQVIGWRRDNSAKPEGERAGCFPEMIWASDITRPKDGHP